MPTWHGSQVWRYVAREGKVCAKTARAANERKKTREGRREGEKGCVFAAFLGLSTKSHPRLDFGFVSKSRERRCSALRLDVSIQLAAFRRRDERSGYVDDPMGLSLSSFSKFSSTCLSIYHWYRKRSLSLSFSLSPSTRWVDFIRSERGSTVAIAIPWHTIMKIYRELTENGDEIIERWLIAVLSSLLSESFQGLSIRGFVFFFSFLLSSIPRGQ